MGFHEVTFPPRISYESRGGPAFNNKLIDLSSGSTEAIARWASPRFVYDVSYGIKNQTDAAELMRFFIARLGSANGFRYKDFFHFTTASDHVSAYAYNDATLGVGDGTTVQFQLRKEYANTQVVYKNIYKPLAGLVKIGVNGSEVASSGNWSFDSTTGLVTFNVAPTAGHIVTGGCQFDMPLRFDRQLDPGFMFKISGYDNREVDPIILVEYNNETFLNEDVDYGSSAEITMTADISISAGRGRVLRLAPTANRNVHLPRPADYPLGGAHWYIWNDSAFTLTFKTAGSTTFSLSGGVRTTVCNGLVSGVPTWIAF